MIRSGRALSHNWCEFFVPRLEDRSVPIVVAQSPFPFFWLLMASKLLFVEEVNAHRQASLRLSFGMAEQIRTLMLSSSRPRNEIESQSGGVQPIATSCKARRL